MLTKKEYAAAQKKAAHMITKAGITIRKDERNQISVADFGLGKLDIEGGQILTFFNTDRISAKVIAMFPGQTLPEHKHPKAGEDPGKQEVIRVVDGTLYLYMPGTQNIAFGQIPQGKEECYSVRHESVMQAGDQIIIAPGTRHWFQAGEKGAVVYSFATCVRDLLDEFTDPAIVRMTQVDNR